MKIKIIQDGMPIRVFHEARELIYDKRDKTVLITSTNEKFKVTKRELDWKDCTDKDYYEEIHAYFTVEPFDRRSYHS